MSNPKLRKTVGDLVSPVSSASVRQAENRQRGEWSPEELATINRIRITRIELLDKLSDDEKRKLQFFGIMLLSRADQAEQVDVRELVKICRTLKTVMVKTLDVIEENTTDNASTRSMVKRVQGMLAGTVVAVAVAAGLTAAVSMQTNDLIRALSAAADISAH